MWDELPQLDFPDVSGLNTDFISQWLTNGVQPGWENWMGNIDQGTGGWNPEGIGIDLGGSDFLSGLQGSSPSVWGQIAKALGLTGSNGSVNLSSLLPMAAALGSGIYGMNQTSKATQQTTDAINKANEQITSMLGGAQNAYTPYVDAGKVALNKLASFPQSNLASKYQPLSGQGGMTLAKMAGKR